MYLQTRSPIATLDLVLYLHWIPSELRQIIKRCVAEPLDDAIIIHAVKLWMVEREEATIRYGKISDWDTSKITVMAYLFASTESTRSNVAMRSFNENIENWDVTNVVTMEGMFQGCVFYNQPLNKWNINKLTNMAYLFNKCHSFNQPLDKWDTKSVTTLKATFADAQVFNQDVYEWNVGRVITMERMFEGAHSFNQPLNGWDVGTVQNMSNMFQYAYRFNQPLDRWDVNNVTIMNSMFEEAIAFNQPLETWNIVSVTHMDSMFKAALSFNQSLNGWTFRSDHLLSSSNMFLGAVSFELHNAHQWLKVDDANANASSTLPLHVARIQRLPMIAMLYQWKERLSNYRYYYIVYIRAWNAMNKFYIRNVQCSIIGVCQPWIVIGTAIFVLYALMEIQVGSSVSTNEFILIFVLKILIEVLQAIDIR